MFWKLRKRRKSYAVNPKSTMIPSDGRKTPIKMAGYLEKRSKMRVVCRWKKFWFVLEGRLLLYYKSQLEYLSLSPCRGTVNIGLAASVIPGKSNEIVVTTRSTTVTLRALNRNDHDVWLQALMDALFVPSSNHHNCCSKPVHHFRYSTGILNQTTGRTEEIYSRTNTITPIYCKSTIHNEHLKDTVIHEEQKILPLKEKLKDHKSSPQEEDVGVKGEEVEEKAQRRNSVNKLNTCENRNYKIEKLSRKFSKIAMSDTSIPGKFKLTSNENFKTNLRRSISVEEELNRYSENIYESLKEVNKFEQNLYSKQTRKFVNRVNRSDSDCLMMIAREKLDRIPFRSQEKIRSLNSCYYSPCHVHEKYGETFYTRPPADEHQNLNGADKLWKLKMKYNDIARQNYEKEIKSDTDLSVRRRRDHYSENKPKHYGALSTPPLHKRNSESYDFSNLREIIREKTRAPIPLPATINIRPAKVSRSDSILRNLTRSRYSDKCNSSTSSELVKRSSVKKKSLSFLRKIWKKKETTNWEVDSFSSELNRQFLQQEMQGPGSDYDNTSDFSTTDLSTGYDAPLPEPPPDYDQVQDIDEEVALIEPAPVVLPLRIQDNRTPSPVKNSQHFMETPVVKELEPLPPALPVKVRKLRKNNSNALDFLFHDSGDPGLRYLFQEEEYLNHDNDLIINNNNNNNYNNSQDLGEMLKKLNEINSAPLTGFHLCENDRNSFGVRKGQNEEDPDYDVPRPHVSLLSNLKKETYAHDSLLATHFFSQYEDSLDVNTEKDRYEDFTMAPDSLECDRWSQNNEVILHHGGNWSLNCDAAPPSKSMTDHPNQDSFYQDSLNPIIHHGHHRINEIIHLPNGFIHLHT